MAGRRKLSKFFGDLTRQSTEPAGWVVGIGIGSVLTALTLTGTTAIVLAYAGGAAIAGGAAAGIYKAVPPRRRTAAELNAQRVSIEEVLALDPPVFKLGVVGDSEAGKTTLINRLLQRPLPQQRTQGVSAYIAALQTNPPSYVAFIDGGGEEFAQQFRVAEYADALCVVLDHNRSHVDAAIDLGRLRDSQEFQRQLLGYIKHARSADKPFVWLMINKRDLWEKLGKKDLQPLLDALDAIKEGWMQSNLAKEVVVLNHSNMIGDDVAAFHALLVQHCR